jgi:hypothetical protein
MIPKVPPSFYFTPRYTNPCGVNTWLEHLPFAYDLVQSLRPSLLVELGTYYGESYFGFCQAVEESGIECECYAVDTWKGDQHAGFYDDSVFEQVQAHHQAHYQRFSSLICAPFDEAVQRFEDDSIAVLHIDGLHTYDAVSHDFRLWFPKVRPGGVILLHDIVVKDHDFGVFRLWDELQQRFPTFAFHHSHGLGLLRKPIDHCDDELAELLCAGHQDQEEVRRYYAQRGAQLLKEVQSQPRHARVQLFFPDSSGYSERASRFRYIALNDWQTVQFCVPSPTAGRLRLDPVDSPGIIEIAELTLYPRNATTPLWSLGPASMKEIDLAGTAFRVPSEEVLTIFSNGQDPQVLLPKVPVESAGVTLRASIRVKTGVSALADFSATLLQDGWAGVGLPKHRRAALLTSQPKISRSDSSNRRS